MSDPAIALEGAQFHLSRTETVEAEEGTESTTKKYNDTNVDSNTDTGAGDFAEPADEGEVESSGTTSVMEIMSTGWTTLKELPWWQPMKMVEIFSTIFLMANTLWKK